MQTTMPRDEMATQRHDAGAGSPRGPRGLSRRGFLGRAGSVVAATATAGTLVTVPLGGATSTPRARAEGARATAQARADQAYSVRVAAARRQHARPLPTHLTNGDEARYGATHIANFSKGLPHNALGEVDPAAYDALMGALRSGRPADFEAVPMGGKAKLAVPQAAYAYMLEGPDIWSLPSTPPPAFSSAWEAAEMAECYWAALARDVPFADYATDPLIARAASDLARLSDYRGPKAGGAVTSASIFRGGVPGDLTGPYLSQLFWLPVAYGPLKMVQRYPTPHSRNHLTTYAEWLTVQNGHFKAAKPTKAASPPPTRYMCTGRDVAAYLHTDFTYQAFLNAALTLGALGVPQDPGNPYLTYKTQGPGPDFGIHHLLDLVAKVANAGLKGVWPAKWLIHRRIRPEEFGGRVHNQMSGTAHYPIHADLLSASSVLAAVHQQQGSYLLPMADPEGCPIHPSYPSAHVVIAGACVTVLKAWFDESYVLRDPIVASPDGQTLLPYTGPALTVGGELNKLASNFVLGRVWEGWHWRTDGSEALRVGEAMAIGMMADERLTFNETFGGFSLTTFDGATITV